MTIAEKLTKIAENVPKVYAQGQQAERDAFWETFQNRIPGKMDYSFAFYTSRWTDDIYKPKYDFVTSMSAGNMFAYSRITNTLVTIDVSQITNSTKQQSLFAYAAMLHTIPLIKVAEHNVYTGWFSNCTALENVKFEGVIGNDINLQFSKKLTRASIENIMNHLWSCGYEYNYSYHTLCEWDGTTLVCSIGDFYREPIYYGEATFTVYNAATGEEITSGWASGGNSCHFTGLDKSVVYAVVATDLIDDSDTYQGTASASYSDGTTPWDSKILTLSREAVDAAFADEIQEGSSSPEWLSLQESHPEWVISLV